MGIRGLIVATLVLPCLVSCGQQEEGGDIPLLGDGKSDFGGEVVFESPYTGNATGSMECAEAGGCDIMVQASLLEGTVSWLRSTGYTGPVINIILSNPHSEDTFNELVLDGTDQDLATHSFPSLNSTPGNYNLWISVTDAAREYLSTHGNGRAIAIAVDVSNNEPAAQATLSMRLRTSGRPASFSFDCDYPEGCNFSVTVLGTARGENCVDSEVDMAAVLLRPDGSEQVEFEALEEPNGAAGGAIRFEFENQLPGHYNVRLSVRSSSQASCDVSMTCMVQLEGTGDEICDNGVDDDHDLNVDCQDSECAAAEACVTGHECRSLSDPCTCIEGPSCIWHNGVDTWAYGCLDINAIDLCDGDCFFSVDRLTDELRTMCFF